VFGDRDLDQVGLVTFGGIQAAGGAAQPQLILAKLRDGPTAKALGAIDRDYTEEIATDLVGGRIVNLHRVRTVPLLGILAAGLMAIFVLVYVLAVSVRARTREHAVLRALGLPVRRLQHVLAWQGGILAVGILIIGVPAGLVLGSALWRHIADGIGVHPGAVLSPWLLLIPPLVLLVAIGSSLVPARRAAREQITELLRAE
jgi:putative ABC transport system permease protein